MDFLFSLLSSTLAHSTAYGTIHPMNFKPQTGDKFHFTQTGNTARLGAQTEDGFEARYVDGPSKGMQVVLSERFLAVAGVMV